MTSNYSIDFNNLVLKDKEVVSDWEGLICENDGSFSCEQQMANFEYNGIDITVYFKLSLKGSFWYTPATYLQPEEGEVEITDVDFDVEEVYIDDYEVELSKDIVKILESSLKKHIEDE